MANINVGEVAASIVSKLMKLGFSQAEAYAMRDAVIRTQKSLTNLGSLTAGTPLPNAVDASGNLLFKNVTQAIGSTNSPSTTSNAFAVIPEMTEVVTTKGNKVLIIFTGVFRVNGAPASTSFCQFQLFRDGVAIWQQYEEDIPTSEANDNWTVTMSFVDVPAAGAHTYDARWAFSGGAGGSLLAFNTTRAMQVVELG